MADPSPPTTPNRPPVPGFQAASSLPRPTPPANAPHHAPSTSSLRNASGGQPVIPKSAASTSPPTASASTDAAPIDGKAGAEAAPNAVAGPSKPVQRPVTRKNAIVYNAVQRRNPVLQGIKNVGLEIGDIVADYQVGTHNGVLFLSLKYHRLHPEYIHQRIEKMKNQYKLRILLVLCDINEHQQTLREISKIAIINEFSTFVAWSNDEVASYLTSFKAQETASANSLKERIHQTYHNQLQHVLTSGKKVNKTDADNLASQFGSFQNIVLQPSKVLSSVKGLGATKVTSLVDAFTKPFLVGGLKREGSDSDDAATTVRPALDLTAEKRTGSGQVNDQSEAGKGKDKAMGNGNGSANAKGAQDHGVGAESATGGGIRTVTEATGDAEEDGQGEEPNGADIGSPDWPSENGEEEDEEDGNDDNSNARRPEPSRGRERVPSRSPGADADELNEGAAGEAWRDPLDDEDEDDDGEEEDDGGAGHTAKRVRVE